MDSNDARRSKVPAGTFRSSSRPPAPAGEDAVAPAAATPPPTLPAASGRPPAPAAPPGAAPTRRVGTQSAAPPKLAPPSEVDGRAKFTSTLVGVTPSKGPPPATGPVLAPPPWRGASAYQGGQEPQPRVSSISSPGVTPSVLADGTVAHPDDRRVPHTRITAAAPPAPPQEAEKPSAATAEIGDAIQQLLDAQTAVSMEGVQESGPVPSGTLRGQHGVPSDTLRGQPPEELLRESALEPVRESQIEVLRDSALEEVEEPADPVRSLPPAAPVAKRSLIDQTQRTLVEPSAVPEPRHAPPSARWSAPTPVVRPAAAEPAMSDRELAAYSFVEREESDASFAPAEDRPGKAPADDSNVRLGIWVAAAMVLVGVGGWAVTRGGFDIPPRTPVAAPVIAAPPPAAPPVSAPVAPAASPELGDVAPVPAPVPAQTVTPAAPAAPATPAPAAEAAKPQETDPVRTPIAARPPRPPRPAAEAEPARAAEAPAASEPVLTVSPSAEATPAPAEPAAPSGPLPETPTRDNVQSALDAKRSEVVACAKGQHGVAEVDLTVSSSGAVTHAVVAGDFAGTPAGSCIARVVRTARFAPFSKPRFRVIYPFSL